VEINVALSLPRDAASVAVGRQVLSGCLEVLGVTPATRSDIALALGEALGVALPAMLAELQALGARVRQLEDGVQSQGSGSNYWHYCRDPAGFYPDVQTCASEWLQVVPIQAPDPTQGAGQ